MGKKPQREPKGKFCRLSFWRTIGDRFPDERACLASFLAYHSAEVLSGFKPGNLVNIPDSIHPCGKNLFNLWHNHGDSLLAESGLRARVLAARPDSLLVYLFCSSALERLLSEKRVRNFLNKAGYSEYRDCEEALDQLEGRMRPGKFPHEIGLFLGYPLKDVAGFLGWAKLPVSAQGAWKIYGDPRKSLELEACHRECRGRMAERLRREGDACRCLRRDHPWKTMTSHWKQTG